MTKRLILLWPLLLLLSACAGPLIQLPNESDQSEEIPAPVEDADSAAERGSSAVSSLIQAARNAYQMGDYSGAIASAERGLRIDRREPELYLLLAQSYLAQARPDQAEQFARQGLRHSGSDTWVSQALKTLLSRL